MTERCLSSRAGWVCRCDTRPSGTPFLSNEHPRQGSPADAWAKARFPRIPSRINRVACQTGQLVSSTMSLHRSKHGGPSLHPWHPAPQRNPGQPSPWNFLELRFLGTRPPQGQHFGFSQLFELSVSLTKYFFLTHLRKWSGLPRVARSSNKIHD